MPILLKHWGRMQPQEPTGTHDLGVLAEQAGKHMPELLWRDEQGQIEGWNYQGMITGHQKLHRWSAERMDALEAALAAKDKTAAELARTVEAQARDIAQLQDAVKRLQAGKDK